MRTDTGRALDWLEEAAAARRAAGLERVLVPRSPGVGRALDLASNDYLGLSRHPDVVAACAAAAQQYGAGATGSRLVTGTTALHEELERALAAHVGTPAALVFSSGYLANLGAVRALAGPETLIVSDAYNHASLIDGCKLSGAETVVAPHADPAAVEAVLAAQSRFAHVSNGRFKGGHITRHYGAPGRGVHALQLEMCQSTYMDETAPFGYRSDLAAAVQPLLMNMLKAALDGAG